MRAEPSKPLSTLRIIWEALKLPTENLNLLLPIVLLTSSILYLANYYTTYSPLHGLFASISPSSPTNLKPIIAEFTVLQSIFLISFLVSTFILITTITDTYITHLVEQATLPDIFIRVKTPWKGPLITQLIVSGLTFPLIMAMFILAVFFFLISNSSLVLILVGMGIVFLVFVFYFRFAILCSFAVSVMEDGCYGMVGISRAKGLIEGRRKQLMVIVFLSFGAGGVMVGVLNVLFGSSSMVGGLLTVLVMGLCNMVAAAAYTVFYYNCRRSRGVLYTSLYLYDGYRKGDVV